MKKISPLTKLGIVVLFVIALSSYFFFGPNVRRQDAPLFVHVPTHSTFDDLVTTLKKDNIIRSAWSFRLTAKWMAYIRPEIRAGRFKIQPGWSNFRLIYHLSSGKQSTVKLILHDERTLEEVAGKVARYIEPDSAFLLTKFNDPVFLKPYGFSPINLMSLFIPNTYDFYWNTSIESFLERMQVEHQKFWDADNRRQKAADLNLSPKEVYTLASIVERETNQKKERPRVAGLYLNRLRIGMRLQADPTAVFGSGDYDTPRVTRWHLQYDSPYNTYIYAGLPPGPISMASISSIDAVLNAEKHKYLYMCARPDETGFHNFAKNLEAHNVNARKYRKWLDQKIMSNGQ